jgi:hypothetical protein
MSVTILGVEGMAVAGAAVGAEVAVASPPAQAANSKLVNIRKAITRNLIFTSLRL